MTASSPLPGAAAAGTVPPGSIWLHDSFAPPLTAGDYRVTVTTTAAAVGPQQVLPVPVTYSDELYVSVAGPSVRLHPADVVMTHPPADSSGDYSETLAQAVLARPTLPWDNDPGGGVPWLALLVLDPGIATIVPAATAGTSDLVQVNGASPGILPARADVPLLCHVRDVGTDASDPSIGDGRFAVVTAGRLPAAAGPQRACLVSLMGALDLLDTPTATFTLPLLYSWSFTVAAQGTFRDSMQAVAANAGVLPVSQAAPVLLRHVARDGTAAQAAYRGPLTGDLSTAQPTAGITDVSLDVAGQLGSQLAAADRSLLRELYDWHRADQLAGTVTGSAVPDSLPGSAAAEIIATGMARLPALYRAGMNRWRVPAAGDAAGDWVTAAATPPAGPTAAPADGTRAPAEPGLPPRGHPAGARALRLRLEQAGLLGAPPVPGQVPPQATVPPTAAPPPAAIATFIDGISELRGIPLTYLLPGPGLLPAESIRFFYLDADWLAEVAAGILGVFGTGARAQAFARRRAWTLRAAMHRSLARSRPGSQGTAASPAVVSGFLLRSIGVSRWPQAQIRAFAAPAPADNADAASVTALAPLRLERLTPTLLLGLYPGPLAAVWIEEPHHALALGVAMDGDSVVLPVNKGGQVTNVAVPVRSEDGRSIDVSALVAALGGGGSSVLAAAALRQPFRQVFT